MFRKTHPAVLAAKCFSAHKAGFCCGNCPEHEWASVLTVTWVGLCLDGHMSGPLSWRRVSVLTVTWVGLCLEGHTSGSLSWRSHGRASILTVTRVGLYLDGSYDLFIGCLRPAPVSLRAVIIMLADWFLCLFGCWICITTTHKQGIDKLVEDNKYVLLV